MLLLAAFHAFQRKDTFGIVRVCDLCEESGAFGALEAPALRRKWRELLERRVEAALRLQAKYRWFLESREKASVAVADGVSMNRRLPDGLDLQGAIAALGRILDGEESMIQRNRRHASKVACPGWAASWSSILGSPCKVKSLLLVAVAIANSESGFFSLADARELAEEAFDGEASPWARPFQFKDFLLRYLPVIAIDVRDSNQASHTRFCAKPPESDKYIVQLATLARQANQNSLAVQDKLKSLPVRKYLLYLSQEQDRRVFKGLIAQVTSPQFVQQAFGWRQNLEYCRNHRRTRSHRLLPRRARELSQLICIRHGAQQV